MIRTGLTWRWHMHFLRLAVLWSRMSKDPTTKVGAVLAADRRTYSTGYNGPPPPVPDRPEVFRDRQRKLTLTVHAEENAILNAAFPRAGSVLYVTQHPCAICARLIVAAGVRSVWYLADPVFETRWRESLEAARVVFEAADVSVHRVVHMDLRMDGREMRPSRSAT